MASSKKRMSENNDVARYYLFSKGWRSVYLHPHPRFPDKLYSNYKQWSPVMDLFGVWDGFGLDAKGKLWFLQVGSDWHSVKEFADFYKLTNDVRGLELRITKDGKNAKVEERLYPEHLAKSLCAEVRNSLRESRKRKVSGDSPAH